MSWQRAVWSVRLATMVLAAVSPSRADQPQPDDEVLSASIEVLTSEFKKLGQWEDQFRIINRALDHVWSSNDWTSEPDQYAKETYREVARIPPWELNRRIDKLAQRLADRYELTTVDRDRLRGSLYREMLGFAWNNAGVLYDQVRESVRQRVGQEPFTPHQVAEWVRNAEALSEDFDRRSQRLVRQVGTMVGNGARLRYQRDVERLWARQARIEELRETWKDGGWRPEHWGLDGDPIQDRFVRSPEQPLDEAAADPVSWDPLTWGAYVDWFIRQYDLDAGQATAAQSILVELLQRALDYRRAQAALLTEVPADERATHAHFEPVRLLYAELKQRLDRIPTQGQRQAASRKVR